jgi:hypothetical protein
VLNNLVIIYKHRDHIGNTIDRIKDLNLFNENFTFLYMIIACLGSFFSPRPSSRHRPRINVDIAIPFRIYCGKQHDARDNSSILSKADTLNQQTKKILEFLFFFFFNYLFAKSVALVNNFLI